MDFANVKQKLLETVPNVKAVVPDGDRRRADHLGNTVDLTLAELRDASARPRTHGRHARSSRHRREALKEHVRQIVRVLRGGPGGPRTSTTADAVDPEARGGHRARPSDEFWEGFDKDPYGALEFLENQLAPLVTDADMVPLRYVGTDLDAFQKTFDRMEIVDGQPVPDGPPRLPAVEVLLRGLAQAQDRAAAGHDQGRAATIKGDDRQGPRRCSATSSENRTQTREILLQLDRLKTEKAVAAAAAHAGLQRDRTWTSSCDAFFDTDDANFDERYQRLLPGPRAAAAALPPPRRRHPDHHRLHAERLRPEP